MSNEEGLMIEVSNHWHLDKKVIIAIILALVTNTVSYVWWQSWIDKSVHDNTARIQQNSDTIKTIQLEGRGVYERLSRIEAYQQMQTETLKEIKEAIKEIN